MASSAGAKEAERQGLVEAGASGPAAGSPTRRSRLEMRCGCLAVSLVLGALLLMAVRPAAPQRASSPHRDWEEARRWVAEPGQALRLPVSRAVEVRAARHPQPPCPRRKMAQREGVVYWYNNCYMPGYRCLQGVKKLVASLYTSNMLTSASTVCLV